MLIIKTQLKKYKFLLVGLSFSAMLKIINSLTPVDFHIGWVVIILLSIVIQYLVNKLDIAMIKVDSLKDLVYCPRCNKVEKDGIQTDLEKIIHDNVVGMGMKVCDKCKVYGERLGAPADAFIKNLKEFLDLLVKKNN